MSTADYKLFTPLTIGKDLVLKNRVVMAPLTRGRSDIRTREAVELNGLYYEQRAGAGLIISEASAVSEQGYGWIGSPAMYTEAHAAAWKPVVDRVHAKGGKIFLQLWHMGRQVHSSFNSKGEVVSVSTVGITAGHIRDADGNAVPHQIPRALETEEVAGIVEDYRASAALAKEAGFDGVEIHASGGYLIDTFLQSCTNQRDDKYGGSFENRARFLLEIIAALETVWPADRIGVRVSPNWEYGQMGSADNHEFFTYLLEQLSVHQLAFVSVLDGIGFGHHGKSRTFTVFDAKSAFKGPVFGVASYTHDTAEGAIRSGAADAVNFGRPYIANPDLVERFRNNWPLNPLPARDSWWLTGKGEEGYTTFSNYAGEEAEK